MIKLILFDVYHSRSMRAWLLKLTAIVLLLFPLMIVIGDKNTLVILYSIHVLFFLTLFNFAITSRLVDKSLYGDLALGIGIKSNSLNVIVIGFVFWIYEAIFVIIYIGVVATLTTLLLFVFIVVASLISFYVETRRSKSMRQFLMTKILITLPLIIWFKFDSIPSLEDYNLIKVLSDVGYYQLIVIASIAFLGVYVYKGNEPLTEVVEKDKE